MSRRIRFVVALVSLCAWACACGTAVAGNYKQVYSFGNGAKGVGPYGTLTAVDGVLYGTASAGDRKGSPCSGGCGTVFSVDPATGAATVIHDFTGGADGYQPMAGLIHVGHTLYGTTIYGGGAASCGGCGTVFSVDLKTGAEKVVYAFAGSPDGSEPELARLTFLGGKLYGVTFGGGGTQCLLGCGTVFSIDLATGSETVLHSFTGGNDGNYPAGGLIASGNLLYGTTARGGPADAGTLFSIDPVTGAKTILHNFAGSDGNYPNGELIAVGGVFYGATGLGGDANCFCGTIFSFDPSSGTETVLYDFVTQSGALPNGVTIAGGHLYGTTQSGGSAACQFGAFSCGTVFSVDLATKTEKVLHNFAGASDGAVPNGGVIVLHGHLYGSTLAGGGTSKTCSASGCGTIFSDRR